MAHKAAITLLLTALASSSAWAENWAEKMFDTTSHDFGSVAKSAKTEHEFVLKNIYMEDVHIESVRSSCGCTRARIKEPWLKTYETTAIVADINTKSFRGRKPATITVTFDKPFRAQVRLQSKVYIRTDVLIEPGSVDLGSVEQGNPIEKKVTITRTGQSDWQVMEVKCANPHISGEVVETRRSGGNVSYELSVFLNENAPSGYIQDHLMLVTNDQSSTQVPVLVEGVVQSPITVSPASLFLGVVQPGQKVTKQLVVKGNKPFKIVAVNCDDDSFEFTTPIDGVARLIHLIPVTFIAGEEVGKVLKTIRIVTDLTGAPPELSAFAVVSP